MKYTSVRTDRKGRKTWTFKPPQRYQDAGISKPHIFKDGRAARYEVPRLLEVLREFDKGGIVAVAINKEHNLTHAIFHYLKTKHFVGSIKNHVLAELTLKAISKDRGQVQLKYLNSISLNKIYQDWIKSYGVHKANAWANNLTHLFDYLVLSGVVEHNFVKSIVKQSQAGELVVKKISPLTDEDVEKVITECFKTFKDSSLGLAILLTYETAQTSTLITSLVWDNLDLEMGVVSFPSKSLTLPLTASTIRLLVQQKEMWGFQKWVVPYHRKSDHSYRPLASRILTHRLNTLATSAGIEGSLTMRAVRDVAIKSMITLGLDSASLANLLGQSVECIKHYYHNTDKRDILARRFPDVEEG